MKFITTILSLTQTISHIINIFPYWKTTHTALSKFWPISMKNDIEKIVYSLSMKL